MSARRRARRWRWRDVGEKGARERDGEGKRGSPANAACAATLRRRNATLPCFSSARQGDSQRARRVANAHCMAVCLAGCLSRAFARTDDCKRKACADNEPAGSAMCASAFSARPRMRSPARASMRARQATAPSFKRGASVVWNAGVAPPPALHLRFPGDRATLPFSRFARRAAAFRAW